LGDRNHSLSVLSEKPQKLKNTGNYVAYVIYEKYVIVFPCIARKRTGLTKEYFFPVLLWPTIKGTLLGYSLSGRK
jgi:hypothetical protein